MTRVIITGSSDGLGLMAARLLIEQGHEVGLHGRNEGRSRDAFAAAPGASGVVCGDPATIAGAKTVAGEVNKLGRFDAVIHNAGVGYREGRVEMEPRVPSVFAVNVFAPYILTALIERPKRLVYLSSGMHRGVRVRMDDLLWTKRSWSGSSAYAESKLCDVLLAFAVARRWNDVRSNALESGWVATKMGGPSAPDDLHQGCVPRRGLPRATTSRRDRLAGISIINALVRRIRSRPTSGLRKNCWPSAAASQASVSTDFCTSRARWSRSESRRGCRSGVVRCH